MGSSRRPRTVFSILAVATAVLCAAPGSAPAKPKVTKTYPTRVALSATRAGDGTITVKAEFSSPEPRCLSAKRLLQKKFHGMSSAAGGYLLFGGAYSDDRGSGSFGLEGSVDFTGGLPGSGLLSPVGKPERSPFVWEATWPGDTSVIVTNFHDSAKPRHYQTTIAAASAVSLGAVARESGGQGLPYFKTTYDKGGKHYVIKCGVLKKSETPRLIAL
jgi:hypothetical protein